ncbi:MAG: hypothetical protein IT445_17090 [Phycisphaeraceae bacterium]|nr:hypothetical protein [Phycisphaeraceae bacterium]
MNPTDRQARQISIAAAVVLAGIFLSGPVAVVLVEVLAPQPAWQGVTTFIEHFSWLQSLPYMFGFFIAGGFILLVSSIPVGEADDRRPFRSVALAFTSVSAGLIFFNYVMQTAFIPLSMHESPEIVAAATMANPNSLGWALEMYGYAILGIATAFIAPLFGTSRRQRVIARLFVLNCILSVVGALLMPIFPGWVLTGTGMLLGAAWNILIAVVMVLLLVEFKFGRR